MIKGYLYALLFFALGFICTLCLRGGEQFTLALVSFLTSAAIASVTTIHQFEERNKIK